LLGTLPSESMKTVLHLSLDYHKQENNTLKPNISRTNHGVPFISRSRVSSVNWKKGIPRSWLVHPWDELAYLIQKFITCEGRFNIIYLYHIKLLQHLRGDCEINLPYFLLQSLSKMARTVQKQDRNTGRSLYHCGLIKMIVKNELLKQNMNWQQFTIENGFETVKEEEERHILVMTDDDDDEEEEQHPKVTSPKLPLRGRKTRSMVLKEKELAEKEKIFTTYERRIRKRPQVQKGQIQEEDDRAQQAQYEHIQTLEAQTFDETFEVQETPTYAQMKVDMEQLIQDMKEEPQMEEAAGTSTTELDRKNKKIRKMKRKIKEIEILERYIKTENEMLRTQSHRTQEENDNLKKEKQKAPKTKQVDFQASLQMVPAEKGLQG
jgi:hypothetical protein